MLLIVILLISAYSFCSMLKKTNDCVKFLPNRIHLGKKMYFVNEVYLRSTPSMEYYDEVEQKSM